MASDRIKVLLEQALKLLSENQPQMAIQVLDQIGPEGEINSDLLTYRGLAMAKLGQDEQAEELMERAVELSPSESRHRFALAVQLRDMGKREESLKQAAETRRLDPKFPGIERLYRSLGMDLTAEAKPTLRDKLFAPPLKAPPFGQFHAFPALALAERPWTVLGWVLVALGFVGPLLAWIHLPVHSPGPGEPSGLPFFGGVRFNSDALSLSTVFLYVTVSLLCVGWMLTDMLDRRSRVLWLIPLVPFCCLGGMPGIALALYLSLGRKQ